MLWILSHIPQCRCTIVPYPWTFRKGPDKFGKLRYRWRSHVPTNQSGCSVYPSTTVSEINRTNNKHRYLLEGFITRNMLSDESFLLTFGSGFRTHTTTLSEIGRSSSSIASSVVFITTEKTEIIFFKKSITKWMRGQNNG